MLKTALKEVAKQPKESVRNANKVRQIVAEEIGEHEAVKEDDKENPNKSLQLDEVMDVEGKPGLFHYQLLPKPDIFNI